MKASALLSLVAFVPGTTRPDMPNTTAGQRYAAQWQAAEDANGIPRGLLAGLIDHETGGTWNPRAYRNEPAVQDASRGLTQLLWATAQGLGYDGSPDDLFDPGTSIRLGAIYLRQQYDRTGSWDAALSAYNGGYRPSLGFGGTLLQSKTVVLAWSTTTPVVPVQTRTAQAGEFANQPYVNDVISRAGAFGYGAASFSPDGTSSAGFGPLGIIILLGIGVGVLAKKLGWIP